MSGAIMAKRRNWRTISLLLAGASVALFVGANAHLIYVAFASQPDCLEHTRAGANNSGAFSAAKSSC